jgi:hypothetical protein
VGNYPGRKADLPQGADCVEKLGGNASGVIQGVDLGKIYLSPSTQTDNLDDFLATQ